MGSSISMCKNNDNNDGINIEEFIPKTQSKTFSDLLETLMIYIKTSLNKEDLRYKIEYLVFILNYLEELSKLIDELEIDDSFLNQDYIKNQFKTILNCMVCNDLTNLSLETDLFINLIIK